MPLYEYQCRSCGHRFERIQKFSDPLVTECPECGAHEVEKLISSPAFQFKGSGWYITDYARKSESSGSESPSTASSSDAKDKAASSGDSSAKSSGDKSAEKPAAKSSDAPSKPAGSGTSS